MQKTNSTFLCNNRQLPGPERAHTGAFPHPIGVAHFGIAELGFSNNEFFPMLAQRLSQLEGVFSGANFEPTPACDCNHSTAAYADDRLPVALPQCSKGSRFLGIIVIRHQTLTREEL